MVAGTWVFGTAIRAGAAVDEERVAFRASPDELVRFESLELFAKDQFPSDDTFAGYVVGGGGGHDRIGVVSSSALAFVQKRCAVRCLRGCMEREVEKVSRSKACYFQ